MQKKFLVLLSAFLFLTNAAYGKEDRVLQASVQETQDATLDSPLVEKPKKKKAAKKGKKSKKAKKDLGN